MTHPEMPIPGPPSSTGRRERKKQEKLRRIREAAEALFREKGFEAATVREIADRADVASGTVFLYVADKRDLLFLIYGDRIAEVTRDALRDLPSTGPLVEQLMSVFGRLFDLYAEAPELALHFVKEQFHGDGTHQQEMNRVRHAFFQRLSALVREAQARGEVSGEADAGLVVWSSFTLYFGALMGWLGGWTSREQAFHGMLRPALELLCRGLGPGESAATDDEPEGT